MWFTYRILSQIGFSRSRYWGGLWCAEIYYRIQIQCKEAGQITKQMSSVQFSHPVVMSDSLPPHGLQHAGLSHPSPTPGTCSNPRTSSWWCHQTISSSVVPFSCLQSFPAAGSFQMSQVFPSGGQSVGGSALTSILPMNIQDWISFRMNRLNLLAVQGTLKNLLQHHSWKASILQRSALRSNSHIHKWLLEKPQL